MRLAIVDDSSAVRSRLVALLGEITGVEIVGEAGDGDTALTMLTSRAIDALLLDLNLPGIGGLELLRRMALETTRPMVIVLTNQPTDHHRAECMRLGADFFFDKSRDVERVLAVVRAHAAASRSARWKTRKS